MLLDDDYRMTEFNSLYVLKRIFVIQLTIIFNICKKLLKKSHEMHNATTTKTNP